MLKHETLLRIDRVARAETTRFTALVGICDLRPEQDFIGADFHGIDLKNDDLTGFDFSRPHLASADMSGADLRRTKGLETADLSNILYDATTRWPPELVFSDGMVLIPSGSYTMGTTDAELKREKVPDRWHEQERPRRKVTFDRPFLLGRTPVTVGEFRQFAEDQGYVVETGAYGYVPGQGYEKSDAFSWRDPGFPQTDRDPVVCVGPADAEKYAEWLGPRNGKTYRLPSEAEWEYACRAGTKFARFWGDDREDAVHFANMRDLSLARERKEKPDPNTYFQHDDGFPFTSPVGSFLPNPWGLFDMLGNAWEWMADDWFETLEGATGTAAARTTPDSTRLRVLRGGSWNDHPWNVRSGSRIGINVRSSNAGFRLARTL